MKKFIGIAAGLSLLILIIGILAGSGLKSQALKVAEQQWKYRVHYKSQSFVNLVADTLNQEFRLLEQVKNLIKIDPNLIQAEQPKLFALLQELQQQKALNNEIALGLYQIADQRVSPFWQFQAAEKLTASAAERTALRLALYKTSKTPNAIHYTHLPEFSDVEDNALLSLAFEAHKQTLILVSVVNISMLDTGLTYFFKPQGFELDIHLQQEDKQLFKLSIGERQVTDYPATIKKANPIGEWHFNVKPDADFAGGINTDVASTRFTLALVLSLILIVIVCAIAFLGGVAAKALERCAAQLKASRELTQYLQNNLENNAENTINGILLPKIAEKVTKPLSKSISTISSLEEVAFIFKEKLESNKVSRSQLNSFVENTTQICQNSVQNIMQSTEQLFNIAKICEYQQTDTAEKITLKYYIDEMISLLQPQLQRREHKFILNIPEDIRLTIRLGSLSLVLTHIVLNAIRHGLARSAKGVIMIEALKGPEKGMISLRVEDNGCGIDEALLADLSKGLDSSKAVGLKLCAQRTVSHLHGSIKIESKQSKFTRVTLSVPRNGKPRPPAASGETEAKPAEQAQ
ncbi:hypothetical protein C2869_09055 [Saccharobesus litoralis]|uniref:Histidine kinase domain-containing protein n=1 Tax=Saccharobesus litoralis TaxID=2172099 RepID=A0A2S0VQU7_9ALTE|nr:ATP-binding protein [Saccharobesus litoralis]AWB66569.1 hypothetical protein C2869_09055 [Saccharobesus litoralis]